MNKLWFDAGCTRCARLTRYLQQVRSEHIDYYCRPVPPFGDREARVLVVGLAPGKHGANASGRPFTGDFAGILLYETLYRHGFATRPQSRHRQDGLELNLCRITNAVKCLPPENRPLLNEIVNCNAYLSAELNGMASGGVVVGLGVIAHNAVLRALELRQSRYPFEHGRVHMLPSGLHLIDSYHCSRYNTQTRRLTPEMFDQVFQKVNAVLGRV